ncbi:hypothetical protein RHGRI_024122 [Rhododendron griersonianum]|uniref:MULE transposase domain-containing protein n=1 Tax=Rhododendron griersonianum TaxID=479676 RepID=A0AAV6J6G3_9ERIC|nr:hypothetical protein RHGRI_024122 [Rhododendron griersonianum]
MYTYIGVEVVDDNGVNIIFDVADGISGYTPTLYTEVLDDNNFRQEVGGSHCNSLPIHRSTERSHRPHERDPSKQQYLYDDTCFAGDMHNDSTILEQHNDYVEHDSAFDNNLGDDNDVSQSSEEDVDEGLEAEDHEEHEIPEFEPPSSMFTDDTWTNIVDPSPQMPTKSHIGWDGHCELFKGQNTVKKYTMQQNNVVKTSVSSPTTLVYKCKNPVPCQWRLRARKCNDVDEWIISRYAGPHTCVAESVSQDHHNLDARFISEIIAPVVKKDASIKVKVLQAMILDRSDGFQPSYAKTWAAKQIAIARIFGNWDESYAEVESFLAAVKVKNPGTEYILLSKDTNIPGCLTFDRLFWTFGQAIEGFKHYRLVISIDGTFLTGKYKGIILVVVSQDAKNQIFPIAFAIVEREDADNWGCCNKLQQWKMPCSLVLAVCMFMKTSPFEYFSDVWSFKSIIQMYASQPFRPPCDKAYWPEINGPTIIPDRERIRGRGRPQITRFRNEMYWIEHQPSQRQSCALCGQGHNRRKCSGSRAQASSSRTNF